MSALTIVPLVIFAEVIDSSAIVAVAVIPVHPDPSPSKPVAVKVPYSVASPFFKI